MRKNLEPLKYSTLAPSRYTVYLHATEFARLEGIIPILQEQTTRALTEELEKLNHRPRLLNVGGSLAPRLEPRGPQRRRRVADRFPRRPRRRHERRRSADRLRARSAGQARARRGRTHAADHHRPRRFADVDARTDGQPRAHCRGERLFARIEYDDDAGHHVFEVVKDSSTIGRGGIAYPVDIRIASSPDVSREHARLRRDPQTGRFFLIDLSSLGTTLNGRHVPKGLRRGRRNETRERRRDGAARRREDRSGGHHYSQLRSAAVMTALLWARPAFAVVLLALVGFYVWTAHKTDVRQ